MLDLKIMFGDGHEEIVKIKDLFLCSDGGVGYRDKDGNLVILPKGYKEIKILGRRC